ncbi:MAG: YcaO-like family protein [Bacteroidota bacterium]
MELSTQFINPNQEHLPNLMSEIEGHTITDMLSLYYPNGPIGKAVACYGAAGVSQILSVNCGFYRINHMVKQMLGIPSLDTGLDKSMVAGGKGNTIPSSFLGALGEGYERFAGILKAFSSDLRLLTGSYASLTKQGVPCLHPSDLPLFHEEQFQQPGFFFERFEEDTVIRWVQGHRLISEEEVWVPAQLALFFYLQDPSEATIAYAASCGMAAHIDRNLAVYNGITELIERDAMMVSWYAHVPPIRLEFDRPLGSREFERYRARLDRLSGNYTCYLHKLDMPDLYTVSAIEVVQHMNQYGYYAGGAAAVDIDEAIEGALVEYGQSEAQLKLASLAPERSSAAGARYYFWAEADKPHREMATFLEHLGYYGHPVNWPALEWFHNDGGSVKLTELPAPVPFETSEDKLRALTDKLSTYGIDPIVIDQAPPQFRQMAAVKVMIPELVHPHVSARPYLGHPRIWEMRKRVGLSDRTMRFDELQPGPVPFP